jgi:hypothetical protein
MDDLMTRLAERLDAEQWPPLAIDGPEIRHRGRRRHLQRRLVSVGGVGVAVGAVVAVPLTVSSWTGHADPSPAAAGIIRAGNDGDVTSIFDVAVTLPTGWEAQQIEAPAGQLRACLGPAPVNTASCAVTIAVAADPENALTDGVHPIELVDSDCQPGDPNMITVTELMVDGRRAHQWSAQCSLGDPTRQEWALDNGTFAVVSDDVAWDSDAQGLFLAARTPVDWPHRDAAFAVATTSDR